RTRDGVSGRRMSERPRASATALAMQTGVLMLLPSPTPLAPSGVNGEGVSMCRISGSTASGAVDLHRADIEDEAVAQRAVDAVLVARRGELRRAPERGLAQAAGFAFR